MPLATLQLTLPCAHGRLSARGSAPQLRCTTRPRTLSLPSHMPMFLNSVHHKPAHLERAALLAHAPAPLYVLPYACCSHRIPPEGCTAAWHARAPPRRQHVSPAPPAPACNPTAAAAAAAAAFPRAASCAAAQLAARGAGEH